jgi:hypothetical protein
MGYVETGRPAPRRRSGRILANRQGSLRKGYQKKTRMNLGNIEITIKTKEYLSLVIPWVFIFSFGYMQIEGRKRKHWFAITWIKQFFYKEIWF